MADILQTSWAYTGLTISDSRLPISQVDLSKFVFILYKQIEEF